MRLLELISSSMRLKNLNVWKFECLIVWGGNILGHDIWSPSLWNVIGLCAWNLSFLEHSIQRYPLAGIWIYLNLFECVAKVLWHSLLDHLFLQHLASMLPFLHAAALWWPYDDSNHTYAVFDKFWLYAVFGSTLFLAVRCFWPYAVFALTCL